MRTGGQIVVDALRIHGADTVFCVPGESYLPVLDALHGAGDAIRLITCRHEGGAANMADSHGKLTGKPGICFVTRGPGATNASIGVHTAFQDSTPMILFVGQVHRGHLGREAFQEVDFTKMFGDMTKWTAQVDDPARLPEFISRAFHTATSGRPGPVVLALPQDILSQQCQTADLKPYQVIQPSPADGDIDQLVAMLSKAERPFVMLGGSGWSREACADIRTFIEANNLPAGVSFRCQDLLDNSSPSYAGHIGIGISPKLAERVTGADLIVAIGPRLGEMTTGGYTLLDAPRTRQKLVHVHAGAEELNRVYQADLAINAGVGTLGRKLRRRAAAEPGRWAEWTAGARADYEAFIEPVPCPGALDLAAIFIALRQHLPDDAIITNGAGNYTAWSHRFHQFRSYRSQIAPTSGAMGYGLPAAIAAKIAASERCVVALAGDGCFLMTGQELATAVQYRANVIVLIINNSMYGTIRMHQERNYPGRVCGTSLENPDFAAYAWAFGAYSEIVETTDQFLPAFDRAMKSGKPAVLELRVDPEALAPGKTLSGVRAEAPH
ncbi:MAG: thiamine pyrophosphate-binding protein [Sphingomonadales bacterium]